MLANYLRAITFSILMLKVRSQMSSDNEFYRVDQEYCINDEFKASCLTNEVIVIQSGLYGRMKIGKCLEGETFATMLNANDRNFVGCSADVTHLLNAKCFGKKDCAVRVIYDIDQQISKPCHKGLENYLTVSYNCVSVVEPDRFCKVSVISNLQHIWMMKYLTPDITCGSRSQPWTLEAKRGQQISFSLLDTSKHVNSGNRPETTCVQYGYIIDKEANKNISLCEPESGRTTVFNISKSNILEVFVTDNHKDAVSQSRSALLAISAVGCTDLVPPEDMWLRRRNQEAVVGCYSSRQIWHLNCVNNQWFGVIGNCTRESAEAVSEELLSTHSTVDMQVLVSVVIVFIGLIICVVIVVCGVVCIKRYNEIIQRSKYNHMAEISVNCKLN